MEAATEIEVKIQNKVRTTLQCLDDIWLKIGIGTDSRIDRLTAVDQHVSVLLDNMLSEEKATLTRLQDTIRELRMELKKLCVDLDRQFCQPESDLSLLQLKEVLNKKVIELSVEKKDRVGKLQELHDDERVLCEKLNIPAKIIVIGSVPTLKQLEDFRLQVKNLESELSSRVKAFERIKQNCLKLLKELGLEPESDFERNVICNEADSFVLSDVNMKDLSKYYDKLSTLKLQAKQTADSLREEISTLWDQLCIAEMHRKDFLQTNSGCNPQACSALKDELRRCRQLRMESLSRLTEEAKEELKKFWELCYFSRDQMEEFRPYYDDVVSEENLHLIDIEVCRLRALYERKKSMFDKLKYRQQLWLRFLELEQSSVDPSRFNNRGGQLLKEANERSKLKRELPKVEKEITEEVKEWELATGSSFLIENMCIEDYIKKQWEDYKSDKENEKMIRQAQKVRQTEKETLFGSKNAITPLKRKLNPSAANNISVVPPKLRRMNEIHGTPSKVKYTPSSGLSQMSSHSAVHSKILLESRQQMSATLSKGLSTPNKKDTAGGQLKGIMPVTGVLLENDFKAISEEYRLPTNENIPVDTNIVDMSLASVGLYQDFAAALTERNANPSSTMMKPDYHK